MCDKLFEDSNHDICKEWEKSMKEPIDFLTERFSQLKTSERNVVVTPRVGSDILDSLHSWLEEMEPAYSPSITLKEHLKKVPKLVEFMDTHCVITPYSFSIQKCGAEMCCGLIRTPETDGIRKLAMQR